MSRILLRQPLGLGDHIACHGIVREYAKKCEGVGLFCNPQNIPSVSFMFRDLKNVHILPVRTHEEEERFILKNKFVFGKNKYDSVVEVGSFDPESGIKYERQFYNSAGVPLEKKWESFSVVRDAKKEEELYTKLVKAEPYIFVHDDSRFPLSPLKINSNLPIVRPDLAASKNIFDYCKIIERAAEIHVMDSSFMFLIDCLQYDAPEQKLFVHRYARENLAWNFPILKKNWTILT